MKNLAAVDLNLLLAFEALLIERSVSRAADRVGVVQPSMSRTLAQLRIVFDDELFVRTAKEMRPTAHALALAVAHSDLLAVVPEGVAQVMMLQESIGIHSVPLPLSEWPISVAWTKGGDQDAGIRWSGTVFAGSTPCRCRSSPSSSRQRPIAPSRQTSAQRLGSRQAGPPAA